MADGIWREIQEFRCRHSAFMQRLRRRKSKKEQPKASGSPHVTPIDPAVEQKVIEGLLNPTVEFPVSARELCSKPSIGKSNENAVKEIFQKLEAQMVVFRSQADTTAVTANLEKLSALAESLGVIVRDEPPAKKPRTTDELIEYLLSTPSVKETDSQRMGSEIQELLNSKSVMEQQKLENFQSAGGSRLREFCIHKTREDCRRQRGSSKACAKLHFRKIIQVHTDANLGDCSFLNTCFHMETCKFVHYSIDNSIDEPAALPKVTKSKSTGLQPRTKLTPAQWVNCDLRFFDMTCIGKFSVVMADPPWDIHMELPYGTMSDDEMRALNIPALQDEGYIFLWVTGRAMELGRECLTLWGYDRIDEIVWVKTNQLQRLIRTGRTGHWINHGKEHCLVGAKGSAVVNRGIDCDVIVAEVRATSHKPDEIYGVIERLSPGTRKIELFGRQHNCQPNWMTIGNQLDGIHFEDDDIAESFYLRYPNGERDTFRMGLPSL